MQTSRAFGFEQVCFELGGFTVIGYNANNMFPVLFTLGPVAISSLGVFISLAFVFGSFVVWKRAREEHIDDEDVFDILFISLLGGVVGGRLLFVIFHFQRFGFDLSRWLNLSYSNEISWVGFLLGGMYMLSKVCKRKKIEVAQFLDVGVLGVIIAHIFYRFGQFFDGSYLGIVTSLPVGVNFPGVIGARHPLQLYEILVFVVVYFILKFSERRYRLFGWYQDSRGNAKPGFLWHVYVLILIVLSISLDFITDGRDTMLFFISLRQVILLFIGIGFGISFWMRAGNKLKLPLISEFFSDKPEAKPIRKPMASEAPKSRVRKLKDKSKNSQRLAKTRRNSRFFK
jgi:phosphatidylglycerol:prolipoprotein diacylglycerol transferase